ncbi:MAG: hypothetical protein ACT4OI_06555, partial [Methanobacteriota archaeon]
MRRIGAVCLLVVSVVVLTLVSVPSPAVAGGSTLRIDPEALSGRITQYLLGESEIESAASSSGGGKVVFGANVRLSDEHIPTRVISQTEPTIAVNPANADNLAAGFH